MRSILWAISLGGRINLFHHKAAAHVRRGIHDRAFAGEVERLGGDVATRRYGAELNRLRAKSPLALRSVPLSLYATRRYQRGVVGEEGLAGAWVFGDRSAAGIAAVGGVEIIDTCHFVCVEVRTCRV